METVSHCFLASVAADEKSADGLLALPGTNLHFSLVVFSEGPQRFVFQDETRISVLILLGSACQMEPQVLYAAAVLVQVPSG